MKKILLACLMAISLVGFYGCNSTNPEVAPDTTDELLGAARMGAQASGTASGSAISPVSVSALPANVKAYIASNYAGYKAERAAKDADGNLIVVLENAAEDHKALLFGADGSFKQEIALMQGPGRPGTKGKPGDHGGPGERGPKSFSAIDVASLPAKITSYVTSKYASSTISGAAQNAEKLFIVFVKTTTGKVLLEFNADGSFKQEIVRPGKGKGSFVDITTAELPKTVTDYITKTYAGSTINKAAKSSVDGGFLVWIKKADGTNLGLSFGADGTFKQEMKCTKDQKPTT
jgi:hypothetical protein